MNPLDLSTITVADFKGFFSRDFSYTAAFDPDNPDYITDADIEKAFSEAKIILNQGLFSSDDTIRIGYYYLSAHFLVNDIRTATQGLASTGEFPVNNRSVGSVSEAYAIPDYYANNPILSFYTKTGYGMKYLALVLPNLVGNVGAVCGATLP